MVGKQVQLRAQATADIDYAAAHYVGEAGEAVALRFIDAVEHAVRGISRAPLTGTLRFSYELAIPGLRAWPLGHFPYLMFYVARIERIEVWRVLHTRRDIPGAMADETSDG